MRKFSILILSIVFFSALFISTLREASALPAGCDCTFTEPCTTTSGKAGEKTCPGADDPSVTEPCNWYPSVCSAVPSDCSPCGEVFGVTPPLFVKGAGSGDFGKTVNFITTVLAIVGVVASIIWLLYGGIKYVTAGGDKAAIEGAKTHIISALVGLIIVLFSFVIINLVFSLLGIEGGITQIFTIPDL